MNRQQWYQTYHDVRTPTLGENLFPRHQMAQIAIDIAKAERKEDLLARKRTSH